MFKFMHIAGLELRKTTRDKAMFVWMLLMPLLFTFITGFIIGGGPGNSSDSAEEEAMDQAANVRAVVSITDLDNSEMSQKFIALMEKEPGIQLKKTDEAGSRSNVRDGFVDAGVILPEGFGKTISESGKNTETSVIVVSNANSANGGLAGGRIYSLFTRIKAADLAAEAGGDKTGNVYGTKGLFDKALNNWNSNQAVKVTIRYDEIGSAAAGQESGNNEKSPNTGKKAEPITDMATNSSVGFTVMFVMFTLTMGAGSILEEKRSGTWLRLYGTPTAGAQILSGKILGVFILGYLQAAILILVGDKLFGVNWGSSVAGVLMLLAGFIFAVTGFGLLLSTFLKTFAQMNAVSTFVILVSSMLGGCWWPLEIVPEAMRKAAWFVPQGWAVQGFTDMIARNAGFAGAVLPTAVLVSFGILVSFPAVYRLSKA